MKRIIKSYGKSVVITFSPEDLKIYDLKVGDIIEIHPNKIGKVEEK